MLLLLLLLLLLLAPCSPEFKWPACIILLLGEGAEAVELTFVELLTEPGECCSFAESSAAAAAAALLREYMCTDVGESLLPILPE